MPFKSEKQRAFMYAELPNIAHRWEQHTPIKKLPKYAPKNKNKRRGK